MILRDERRGTEWNVPPTGARLGREPSLEVAFPEADNVVSAVHARVWRGDEGEWWLEDLESTNGTWVDGRRLTSPVLLGTGVRFTLGRRGPALRVTIPGQVARTHAELVSGQLPAGTLPEAGEAGEVPHLRLRRVRGGEDLAAAGRDLVIGRAASCSIPLRTVVDTVVSKRHCRVVFEGNLAHLEDLASRNGTFLNGAAVKGRVPLRVGDRIMLGWEGPLFEVRLLGTDAMPEAEGAPYQPGREPPKTLAGMVQVAEERAREKRGVKPGVFLVSLARQMATESSIAFRTVTMATMAMLIVAVGLLWRNSTLRSREAEARLQNAERAFTAQLRDAADAQRRSNAEIARLERELAAARRSAVSRAVLDSLEMRLRDAEARAATLSPAAAASAPDFTRVAADNQRAVGLVIVRYANDSVMGSGFAITRSGWFVTNRHVVRDELRGSPRLVQVVMAESNVALPADVVVVSSVQEHDVAILKVRGYRGPAVQAIDWYGRGVRQGAYAAVLGFPFGSQLAQDAAGFMHASIFAGVISATGDWIRFGGTTYLGVSGSPLFNASGEVIGVHFGQPREGPGLGIAVPMSRVRRWLPAEARAELGL